MTVSMSSMARQVAFLATKYSIESRDANRWISKTAHLQSQVELEIRNSEREKANSIQGAVSTYQCVRAGVAAAQSVQKAGEACQQANDAVSTQQQLESGMDSRSQLEQTKLGEDGPKVGERFNDRQLDVLTSGEPPPSQEELQKMGFSESEAKEIAAHKDGMSQDAAVEFMWNRRATPDQQAAQQEAAKKGDPKEAVMKMAECLESLTIESLGESQKKLRESASKHDKIAGKLRETGGELRDQATEHQNAIMEIETQALIGADRQRPV